MCSDILLTNLLWVAIQYLLALSNFTLAHWVLARFYWVSGGFLSTVRVDERWNLELNWTRLNRHFDKEKNGRLNHQEFKSCLRALGYDLPMVEEGQVDPEFEQIVDIVDPNRDGYVSLQEYMAFMISKETENVQSSEEIENAFRAITNSERPYVTKEELYAVSPTPLTPLPPSSVVLPSYSFSFYEWLWKQLRSVHSATLRGIKVHRNGCSKSSIFHISFHFIRSSSKVELVSSCSE